MASNVSKLAEREGKISDLSERAEKLEQESQLFQVRERRGDVKDI